MDNQWSDKSEHSRHSAWRFSLLGMFALITWICACAAWLKMLGAKLGELDRELWGLWICPFVLFVILAAGIFRAFVIAIRHFRKRKT